MRIIDFNIDGRRGIAWEADKKAKVQLIDIQKRINQTDLADHFLQKSELMNDSGGMESPIIQGVRVDTKEEKELQRYFRQKGFTASLADRYNFGFFEVF